MHAQVRQAEARSLEHELELVAIVVLNEHGLGHDGIGGYRDESEIEMGRSGCSPRARDKKTRSEARPQRREEAPVAEVFGSVKKRKQRRRHREGFDRVGLGSFRLLALIEDEEDDVGEPTRSEDNGGGGLWPRRSHGTAPGALWWKRRRLCWVAHLRRRRREERERRETLGAKRWLYRGSVGTVVATVALCVLCCLPLLL